MTRGMRHESVKCVSLERGQGTECQEASTPLLLLIISISSPLVVSFCFYAAAVIKLRVEK